MGQVRMPTVMSVGMAEPADEARLLSMGDLHVGGLKLQRHTVHLRVDG